MLTKAINFSSHIGQSPLILHPNIFCSSSFCLVAPISQNLFHVHQNYFQIAMVQTEKIKICIGFIKCTNGDPEHLVGGISFLPSYILSPFPKSPHSLCPFSDPFFLSHSTAKPPLCSDFSLLLPRETAIQLCVFGHLTRTTCMIGNPQALFHDHLVSFFVQYFLFAPSC